MVVILFQVRAVKPKESVALISPLNRRSSMPALRYSLVLCLAISRCMGFAWGELEENRKPPVLTKPGQKLKSPLADTGQTNCYDDTSLQPCATVAATFPGQDAHYADIPVARSLTNATQHALYTNDYVTTDNVTGLVWKSCSENQVGGSCTGTASTRTWAQATSDCSALNAANSGAGFAGITSWRLPNVYEVRTIFNYSSFNPPFTAAQFPNTGIANTLWTSTSDVSVGGNYWFANLVDGSLNGSAPGSLLNVRCVSGTTYAPDTFTDNGDGTATDTSNSLRWQKCSMGQTADATCSGAAGQGTWQAALNYCSSLTLAGRSWRLPNLTELHSLVKASVASPAIETAVFPATQPGQYWTSTAFANVPLTSAWYVSFANGEIYQAGKTSNSYARCVSTGP